MADACTYFGGSLPLDLGAALTVRRSGMLHLVLCGVLRLPLLFLVHFVPITAVSVRA